MLRAVGVFNIHAPSSSSLKLKSNSILDLYLELFISEVEYLLHKGLIKQYRKKTGNLRVLKGNLQFSKHLQHNLTHQEKFYVKHNSYEVEHTLHFILYKTICLLKQINTNAALHSRIGALLLHFPEMPDIRVFESTFDRLVYSRKTEGYRKAIEIARLLLLHYHPDLSEGRNHVLALMFDMNALWERFVYISLRKNMPEDTRIAAQLSKHFWKPEKGYASRIRPDIVITKNDGKCLVLDTKWKNLNGYNPSPEDLRQMYVYLQYFHAQKAALVYPGKASPVKGIYYDPHSGEESERECHVISVDAATDIRSWPKEIYNTIKCNL